MQLLRDYQSWPADLRGCAVAIGNFDGIHRGHLAVLAQLGRVADAHAAPCIVMCFEPHPRKYFQPLSPELRLSGFAEKARQLSAMGVQGLLAQRFSRAFSQLSAEAFIQSVLIEALGARYVITGDDFIFGHNRCGNSDLLSHMAEQTKCFTYDAITPIGNMGEGKFSSSKIREHLRQGEIALAEVMLGRPYIWRRCVLRGQQRGRTIGFPTANLLPPPILLPRHGVYAVHARWQGGAAKGVANLGYRPTVGGQEVQLEVHLLDTDVDLYGQMLEVQFVAHLRDERRFDGLDALKIQIEQDVMAACEALL